MSNRFLTLLESRPFLMLDGATGTNLFQMGLMTGDAPEMWNFEHPEKIEQLHQSFVDAGSDLFLTNSFGGTRYRLKLHDAQDKVYEINREAARIARRVADKAGRPVIVAGSMGPTGELYEPLGPLSIADGADAFAEQARALADGGVDVLWIETMSSREEVTAAVKGAAVTGLPFVTTCSFDTNGRTMMGLTPAEFARFVHELDPKPAAYGANCGVGAPDLVLTVTQLAAAAQPGDIIIAKGNCGIPYYDEGQIRYNGTPALMADYARLVRDAGARLVGGCCGTSPEHLGAIRKSLESHTPGSAPAVETIVEKLGPLTSALAANLNAENPTAGGEGRRGRRRSGGSTPSF
jgi:5-methyltetrahydrofolate--homocysteine methyltransferase